MGEKVQVFICLLCMLRTSSADTCDEYAFCGAYGICGFFKDVSTRDFVECECLKGFVPNHKGCVRRTKLNCSESSDDGFLKQSGIKLPDTSLSWFNETMNLEMCREMCSKNCSCIAYANSDINGGRSGCLLWFYDLMDIRKLSENGQELYIRLTASELGTILFYFF